jgi:hypothetical protein
MKDTISLLEALRRKTENKRIQKLASILRCEPNEIDIWEQMEIDNEDLATYILSYDSFRLAITNIGVSPSLHPMYWNSPIPNHLKGCLGLSEKDQYIAMYGIEAYNKQKPQTQVWQARNWRDNYRKKNRKGVEEQ